jgi:hypothetical protein
MKRLLSLLAIAGLVMAALPAVTNAGPTAGGYASDNVEYVGYVPFEVGTATGVNFFNKDKNMVVTSWKDLSTYDISNPESPSLLAKIPFGFRFENEDVSTNGKIMLFSEQLPQNILHVYDIEDPSNPQEVSTLSGGGGHTSECILNCKFSYASTGAIVDLRKPANPKLLKENWMEIVGVQGGIHDVDEFKNGFIITSPISSAFQVIDVRKPTKPKVLYQGPHPEPENWLFHSGTWPRKGKDKLVMMQGEQNFQERCSDTNGPFTTWDASKVKKTRTFKLIDTYRVQNGTYNDGAPPANALGCSAHWFDDHPKFKNGGFVAVGYYEHGTRFLDIASNGKIKEAGWFVPWGGSTSAAYWVSKDLVYAVDYTRGIDILRYTDKIK